MLELEKGMLVRRVGIWSMLLTLVALALLTLGLRLFLANVEQFKSDIEDELAEYGIQGASFDRLQGRWQGWHPVISIEGASLSIPNHSRSLAISELTLGVKLIPSLLSWDLKLKRLNSRIEKLILVREESGTWKLNDIPLGQSAGDTSIQSNLYLFFQQLPDFVSMDVGLIQLRDQLNGKDYLIQNIQLNSSRLHERLTLKLDAQLPELLGKSLEVRITGDSVQQRLYLKADHLKASELAQLFSTSNLPLSKADVSVEVWTALDHYQVQHVLHRSTVNHVEWLQKGTESAVPISMDVQQSLRREKALWRIDTQVADLKKGQQSLPDVNAQVVLHDDDPDPELWIEKIDISTIKALLFQWLSKEEQQTISNLQPNASIFQMAGKVDLESPLDSLVAFRFEKASSVPFGQVPGLDGVSGKLVVANRRGQLDLESKWAGLTFKDLFRDPLSFQQVDSTAYFEFDRKGIRIDAPKFEVSNKDLKARARVWLDVPFDGIPFMSLRADFENGNAIATSRYLPVSIMPPKTVEWLDRSIRGGRVTSGDMLFHGRLRKLSSLKNTRSGEFIVDFNVEDAQLKFLPDWPGIEDGKGNLVFEHLSLKGEFKDLSIAGSRVEQASIGIDNLLRSRLDIRARSANEAGEMLESLAKLPVVNVIDLLKENTDTMSGRLESVLNLTIPLSGRVKEQLDISVIADMQDVDWQLPPWNIDLSNLKGKLKVRNDQIESEQLTGEFHGGATEIKIAPISGQLFNLSMQGVFETGALIDMLPDYLQGEVSGSSPWTIGLAVPVNTQANESIVSISASSNLVGTQLRYPQPFGKAANMASAIDVELDIDNEQMLDFDVSMNDRLMIWGKTDLAATTDPLKALSVNLSAGAPSHHDAGYHVVGNIDALDFDRWFEYLSRYFNTEEVDSNSVLQDLRHIDLKIGKINWSVQDLADNHLKLNRKGFDLIGSIDSSVMSGDISVPVQMGPETPLQLDLAYLRWKKSDNQSEKRNESKVAINDMFDLDIKAGEFRVNDLQFENFGLRTRSFENRFELAQLDFNHADIKLKSSGEWQMEPVNGDHVSVLNIDIRGKKFGETVNELGLGETIRNGDLSFNGQLGWAGGFFDLDWDSLIGEVRLDLRDGYLRNIEPGAGRFIGLLSFNALPRRLFLDFGDVVGTGTAFNRIKGRFRIKGETMLTDDAYLDAPSARVEITGTTNIREKTYDQKMFIKPKLGDTLPVLGGLAAGSSVGWGLLLLNKIFGGNTDNQDAIEYTVSGSWEDPKVDLITKPVEPEPEADPGAILK